MYGLWLCGACKFYLMHISVNQYDFPMLLIYRFYPSMVVTCPLCACSVPSVTLFMSHLRLIHADSPGFSIQCNLQGCSRTFYKFTTYRNHVYGFHDITAIESTDEEPVVPSRADATAPASRTADPENEDWSLANGDDGENDSYAGDEFVTGISEEILQRATAMWILKTRECHRIPLSVMDAVVSGEHLTAYI